MSNEQFKRDLDRILAKTSEKAEAVIQRVALDLFSSMVERSPVDTGRFRGNWQVGIGAINDNTTSAEDKSGASSTARGQRVIQSFKVGGTVFLTNSLPYARRLEFGYSNQAPQGMVRLTVTEYQNFVRKAAAAL